MNDLLDKLREISNLFGVIGIKQSFEDEGALLEDVISVRRITELCNLLSFVKVGGCEANTDIYNCLKIGINGIIAPMVETPFAVSKFMDCYDKKAQYFIVIESKTAYENIDDILSIAHSKLTGIIVGRSDLSKSYNLNKNEADSDFILSITENIFVKAKKYNLLTTLGGNISVKSSKFIEKMYHLNLLNRFETRNVVIDLNNNNINKIDLVIQEAMNFEILLLRNKLQNSSALIEDYKRRIDLLSSRK
jgi:4-hydroxy-2-oxoheptanedioate aldolase